MAKDELMEFTGTVKELLPNAMFRVLLDNNHEIIAHTAGKMRKFRIRVYENVDTAAVILLVMVCTCYCKFNLPSFSHPSKIGFLWCKM